MQQNIFNNNIKAPLADRMRPRNIEEIIGQRHLLEPGRLLYRAIKMDKLNSSIFYGPPGCGKTTLARIIKNNSKMHFESLNAVTAGVADVRNIIKQAKERRQLEARGTYLFLDECHRWSKAQSDSILPHIESGDICFIGSSTENPSAAMTPAIVSRCRIYQFKALSNDDVRLAIERALSDKDRGYGQESIVIDAEALDYIVNTSNGDIRQALNALELAVEITESQDGLKHIGITTAKECVAIPAVGIDKQAYYDMISALIKSMRGSDSNAAIFWLAQLLNCSVDPRIIARRIMVHASEDVGLADPIALLTAHAAVKAVEFVGMPEARIPLAQAVIAIAEADKSNSVIQAIDSAMEKSKYLGAISVPSHLRDHSFPIQGEKHASYTYPHAYPHSLVQQSYLPVGMEDLSFYTPSDEGFEQKIRQRQIWRKNELKSRKGS